MYRFILREEFGVESAGEIDRARAGDGSWPGSRAGAGSPDPRTGPGQARADALRERAASIMDAAGFDGRRSRALVQKICGVADLRFCRDPRRLKRLLAALGKITSQEGRSTP